ncbi:synaptotagmin-like protein 3 [Salvelinus namaycush]|uniref:Synaptotagmin-like protein 3 n=1 Tax=Salvelinus namaycush TaxID=8040 RepID=A0A8U0TK23_SALNM|nr:synaptotagmin-like protein 3 [Salvelinus namaycush]
MDLSLLKALEREKVLEVLQRDKLLRSTEEDRIRRLKMELQDIRRKGAKSFARQYSERTCARCQRPLGKFWNSGAVCRGCSHCICNKCRVGVSALDWKCTVCHAYREVKFRSGEWFVEERAKKFPPDAGFSRSQEDVRVEQDLLTVYNSRGQSAGQKSLSDTNINKSTNLTKGPSLPNLFRKSRNDDQSGSSSGADEDISLGSEYLEGKRGSSASSTGTDCDLLEIGSVMGELELAIAFNDSTSCLEITINGCRNLAHGDVKRKKCHPYVKVYLLPEKSPSSKLKTTVKRNTTDPIYNEVLQCQMEHPLLSRSTLQVSVWHSGTLKKVFLGEVLIPLEGWMFEESTTQGSSWYPLCPKPESPERSRVEQDTAGELLVRVKFSSMSQPSWVCHTDEVHIGPHDVGQLTVLVTGVKNLPTKANTCQNTYVKGCLTLPGSRELVQRSPVLKKKPSPEWSHQLLFSRVTPYDLQICTLELDLWNHIPFTFSDRLLGWVRMEAGSSWQLVLQRPNMWHDFSLPMQANVNSRRT